MIRLRTGMAPGPARRSHINTNLMKSAFTALLTAGLALSLSAADDSPFKTQKEKVSYVLGMSFGKQLKQGEVELDMEVYAKGVKDTFAGKPQLTEDQAKEILTAFQTEMQTKRVEKQKIEGEKNKKDGEAFLAANKAKAGIVTTASGLQYKVETKGTGKIPGSNDTVICHYRGTLIDGTEFDSSYKRSEPATFPVLGVIKGWTEALQLMPVGSKWKLFIPSEIAYGERGQRNIAPNSVLLFDIELLSIQDPSAAAAPGGPGAAPKIQVQQPRAK